MADDTGSDVFIPSSGPPFLAPIRDLRKVAHTRRQERPRGEVDLMEWRLIGAEGHQLIANGKRAR